MNYTVLDTPTQTVTQTETTTLSIILAITRPLKVVVDEEPQQLEHFIHTYQWHNKWIQTEAQQYLAGALVAYEHNFFQQIGLYKEKLLNIITQDMVRAAQEIISNHKKSYRDFRYTHPDEQPVPEQQFTTPVPSKSDVEWVYYPINAFPRLVPPHAFEILKLLEENKLTPQAYWVADEVEKVKKISVDPVLCAQYGRRFVGIAQWD